MRIVLVIDHLACGGAQRQLCVLATLLKARGLEPYVLTYHRSNDFFAPRVQEFGIRVTPVLSRSKPGRIFAMRRAIRSAKPDAVIAFLDTPNLLAELAGLVSRNFAVIVSERSFDVAGPSLRSFMRFQLHRLADAVVTNSYAQQAFIARTAPFLLPKTHVITNCVDLAEFRPAPAAAQGPSHLLVLGNFAWYKNPVNFGRAVKILAENYPRERFSVAWCGNRFFQGGAPTPQSQPYLELVDLIKRYRLSDAFHLEGPSQNVLAKYCQASAVCVPSIIEGFPNVIGEAMACGIPVLASRTGDNAYLVEDGRNGLLFDCHDPQDMAAKMLQFLRLPHEEQIRMGSHGRARAESLLCPDRFTEKYLQLIESVTGTAASRSTRAA